MSIAFSGGKSPVIRTIQDLDMAAPVSDEARAL
jgi:hypothetical protein